jgi:hypothetical protein
MLTERQLEIALDGMQHLEQIEIRVIDGGFHFRMLGDGGREIVAGRNAPEQIAPMLQVCEVLLNTEFGLREERLCLAGVN